MDLGFEVLDIGHLVTKTDDECSNEKEMDECDTNN
jgi:hypothetical protein